MTVSLWPRNTQILKYKTKGIQWSRVCAEKARKDIMPTHYSFVTVSKYILPRFPIYKTSSLSTSSKKSQRNLSIRWPKEVANTLEVKMDVLSTPCLLRCQKEETLGGGAFLFRVCTKSFIPLIYKWCLFTHRGGKT
jgi:hypothetical protein